MTLITQILHAPENIFYQAINCFQGSWLASTSALVDSGVIYGQTVSPHMASHTNSISLFSSIVNTGWMCWDALTLSSAFQAKEVSLFSTLLSSNSMTLVRMTHIAGAIFSTGAALTVIRSIYHWASYPKKVPQEWSDKIAAEDRASVSLKFEYPLKKSYKQTIYLTRIIMNIAIACLSPERALLCGITAAGLAYGLLKITQVRWLNFTRSFNFKQPTGFQSPNRVQCKQLTYSYIFPLLPNPVAGSQCTICLEDNPSTGFSPASPLDPNCLVDYVYRNSKNIGTHTNPKYTMHIKSGKPDYYSARLAIPEKDLPSCPIGKNHPDSHYVEAEFTDWNMGKFVTTVEVIPDTSTSCPPPLLSEKFWSRLGTVYSAFQAGLTSLQHRHHELASKIITAQTVLCLFDISLLVQNYSQLYQIFYKQTVSKMVDLKTPQQELEKAQTRYDNARLDEERLRNQIETAQAERKNAETIQDLSNRHTRSLQELQTALDQKIAALRTQALTRATLEKRYRYSLYIKMGLGIAAVTAVSAISVSSLNGFLAPFNMTEVLKKVFTPADFSNMKISLSMPLLSYATECILASRLVGNFALAYFSPTQRLSYLSTALLQVFTLGKLAQLPWIKIERTFIYPKGPMWEKDQYGDQRSIKSLQSTFEFLLPRFSTLFPSKHTSANSHFEASIKAAYDYTTQFFKDSGWRRFVVTTTQNGVVISRSGKYILTVKQSLLAECADKLTPFFKQASIWAQDLVYDTSPVYIG